MSHMLSYFKTKSLAEQFCVLGLFLLPYDGLPVMPTHYRPVSVYFFCIATALFILGDWKAKIIVDKSLRYLLNFFIYSAIIGIATSFFYGNPIVNAVDHYAAFVMGFFAYVGVSLYLYRFSSDLLIMDTLTDILAYAYTIPIIVCVIEMLAIYTPFPMSVKLFLNGVFGGWQLNRICGTSTETSWMALHLLTILPVLYYRGWYKQEFFRKVLFVMATIAFVCCFSLTGFLILAIAGIAYCLIRAYVEKQLATALFKFFGFSLILLFAWNLISYAASQMESSYFTARILNFSTSFSFRDLLFLDGSVFVRVGFPIIALQIFFDHPLFGTGAGSFAYMFKDYLLNNFREALEYKEVLYYFTTGTSAYATIYAKVFSEFGLVGGLLWLRFYLHAATNKLASLNSVFIFWTAVLLAIPFQQGSYAYLPMCVGLAIMGTQPAHCVNEILRGG